eukprot:TRINITY_DN32482_c0_g1_i1.p1 TRINITY_DN32482_c0_g1~~TRINITY_DN32482_c0_g1_i1.p1  ORF type:complete len:428 (+),score=102.62 TRINITY_DN32482_c0_g1_i1:96-1379(+)
MPEGGQVGRRRRAVPNRRRVDDEPLPAAVPEPQHAVDELLRARQMRNFYQAEANKLHGMWELTKQEIALVDVQLQKRQEEKAALRERHAVEVETYKEKVRHLIYEHKLFLAHLADEGARAAARAEEGPQPTPPAADLQDEPSTAADDEDAMNQLVALHADRDKQLKTLHALYDRRVEALKEEMAHRTQVDADDGARRAGLRMDDLSHHHDRAYHDLRVYYSGLTSAHVANITAMQDSVAALRKRAGHQEHVMAHLASENKRLAAPLAAGIEEVTAIKQAIVNHDVVLTALRDAEQKEEAVKGAIAGITRAEAGLRAQLEAIRAEKESVAAQYEAMMAVIERRAARRTLHLRKEVAVLTSHIDARGTPGAAATHGTFGTEGLQQRLDAMLQEKNGLVETLQVALASTAQQSADAAAVYQEYFRQYGVS